MKGTLSNQRRFPSRPGAKMRASAKVGRPRRSKRATPKTLEAKRTTFVSMVRRPDEVDRVLVSGVNNRKIGREVTVGRWRGMPIFTLTLEERRTCPDTCHHWVTCYGNNMQWARRHSADDHDALVSAIGRDLSGLAESYPHGFVVRLHVLGDFYSVEYVGIWRAWLSQFPMLRVFGYTARLHEDPIGRALWVLREEQWPRFAMRFSRYKPVEFRREAILGYDDRLGLEPILWTNSFQCPAQKQDDKFCGNCGACWESDYNVVFLAH